MFLSSVVNSYQRNSMASEVQTASNSKMGEKRKFQKETFHNKPVIKFILNKK